MNDERDQDAPSASPAGDTGADVPRLRLRSLKVHAFREIRPGTELRFGDRCHLVLGKNASGKSTLLELLAAVSTLSFRRAFFAETPFHVEASFEIGKILLHAEIRRTFERSRVKIAGDQNVHSPSQEDAELLLRVEIPHVPLRQWVLVHTGKEVIISPADPRDVAGGKTPHITTAAVVDPLDVPMFLALAYGAMEEANGRTRAHSEATPTIDHLFAHPGTGAPFDEALGALHDIVRGGGLTVVRNKGFRLARPAWLPPSLDFEAQGEPITRDLMADPLLRAAVHCLGYDGAKMYFGPGAAVSGGWSYSAPSFQFFRSGKAVRRHDQLSFGQQRLFSFAWYLACNPDVAIADELVNGLHSEWIDWCVEAMRDRQCFLTCQNPLLVDAVPLGTEEDIGRGIILCEVDGDTGQLSFRQLEPRECELLTRALGQSRLDLLSDLLNALNLW